MPSAQAALSLSITPIDGGSGIRFDRVVPGLQNTKQLQIRISSNTGKKYQVFQRVFEPITNEKGQQLNLASVATATLPGSNSAGTLYLQNADHLSYSEQLIYTSGQGGESDSFGIAYSVSPESIGMSGNFRGRIVFTVRSLGEADQTESTVDFFLENTAQLKVSVAGDHDLRRIRIKDTDTSEERADFVRISFTNNGGSEIKFYQEVMAPLTNDAGIELPADAIKLSVQGGNGPNIRLSRNSLSRSRSLLYAGNINEDDFAVYFLVDPQVIQKADAGTYTGQVKYSVESDSGHQEFVLDVECKVEPLFTMDVTVPPEGINFGHVLASSPAQEKQVLITVKSNLHKPYQIVQNMVSPMTNEHGKEFDSKYFMFKVDLSGQKGYTKYADFSPVAAGDYPIYSSNAHGDPVSFTVTYQLKGYFSMDPGNFVAPLKFSLDQN